MREKGEEEEDEEEEEEEREKERERERSPLSGDYEMVCHRLKLWREREEG